LLRCVPLLLLTVIAIPEVAVAQITDVSKQPPLQVATALPANTAGVLLINTNLMAWKELERFNPFPASSFSPFRLPLSLSSAYFWGKAIQPWWGDRAAIAVLPATSSDDTFSDSTVLLIPIQDSARFNAFLDRFKAAQGQPEIERDYKGVTILQWSQSRPAKPGAETFLQEPRLPKAETVLPTQIKAINPKGSEHSPEFVYPLPSIPSPLQPKARRDIKPRNLAIALLPGNVAVSTQPQALEKLIDARSAGGLSLAQNLLFQRTLNHPQFERSLLVGYGDIAGFTRHLKNFTYRSPELTFLALMSPFNESQTGKLTGVYNTVDTHLWIAPEGIHSQSNFYYTTPHPERATPLSVTSAQLLSRLPAATYLSANSRAIKQQWQALTKAGLKDPSSQRIVDSIRKGVRTSTGLDMDKDVISWMDGEYALALFPTTGGLFNYFSPNFNLGLGLMVQTSDRPAAEAALKKLDHFIQSTSRGDVTAVPRRIKGQTVISWEGRDKDKILSILSHGWVSRDTLILTSGVGPMTALNPKPYLPLHLNYTFRTATESLPKPNEGYFYINMGSSLSFLYGLILPSVPRQYIPYIQQAQRVLGTVRSVSSTSSTTPEAQRIDSLLVLGSGNQTK